MSDNNRVTTIHAALEHWTKETPSKTFIYSSSKNYSYHDTTRITNNLASFIQKQNISPKDTICMLLPRTPELIFTFLAAGLVECIPVPINYLETTDTIKKIILSVKPAIIILDRNNITDEVIEFISQYKTTVIYIDEQQANNFIPWKTAIQTPDTLVSHNDITPDSIAYYNLTTGSSGFPKGALCTHANLYWNTTSSIETFKLTENDIHLCMFASFSHPHELFCRALYTGASLVLLTEINPKTITRTIQKYQVTCMMGLAVMYKMMAQYCGDTPLPSLRIAESGGMYTTPEVHKSFFSSFNIPILSVWGSTETTGVALANSPENYHLDGSMGQACPHYRVKIIDNHDREVATGDIGELLFSSAAIVLGYHGSSSFPFKNGWYHSGDLAFVDKEGFYHFVERESGMIKVAGSKVYPLQVELLLQHHPRISEISIIGVSDARRGAVPKAYIVTTDEQPITIDELRSYGKNKLASYMIPKQIQQLTSLPKIGSGKIDKKALALL